MPDLYLSDSLRVVSRLGFNTNTVVITFDSYTNHRRLDRPGFGEAFFEDRKIDAIHFLCRNNDWYQYAELPQAAALVAQIARSYPRALAYGSSMGGYAAIRFGRMVGATTAIALSPQYSIDPAVVPFDDRWLSDAARLSFPFETRPPCPFVDRAIVFSDPYDRRDQQQVALYERHTQLYLIKTPNSGHPSTGFLEEIGILQEAIVRIVHGDFDAADIRRQIRSRRRASAQFYTALAQRSRRANWRLAFAQRAHEIRPDKATYASYYGSVLASLGQFAEAEALHQKALALDPNNLIHLFYLSGSYEHAEEFEKSHDIMAHLVRADPAASLYRARLDYLSKRIREQRRITAAALLPFNATNLDPPSIFPHAFLRAKRRAAISFRRAIGACRSKQPSTIMSHDKIPADLTVEAIESLVTTCPSPPPFISSWWRHREIMTYLPTKPLDIVLIGDSLVEFWPGDLWAPFDIYNLGVAGDRTQHALWRLNELPAGRLEARVAIVMIGTNNLGAGDTAEGVAAGINALADLVRQKLPGASCIVVEILPCGPDFRFRDRTRSRVNALLRQTPLLAMIDAELEISCGFSQPCDNYHEDRIHLSRKGYELLTSISQKALKRVLPEKQ